MSIKSLAILILIKRVITTDWYAAIAVSGAHLSNYRFRP